eukprot:ctg_3391.g799
MCACASRVAPRHTTRAYPEHVGHFHLPPLSSTTGARFPHPDRLPGGAARADRALHRPVRAAPRDARRPVSLGVGTHTRHRDAGRSQSAGDVTGQRVGPAVPVHAVDQPAAVPGGQAVAGRAVGRLAADVRGSRRAVVIASTQAGVGVVYYVGDGWREAHAYRAGGDRCS